MPIYIYSANHDVLPETILQIVRLKNGIDSLIYNEKLNLLYKSADVQRNLELFDNKMKAKHTTFSRYEAALLKK